MLESNRLKKTNRRPADKRKSASPWLVGGVALIVLAIGVFFVLRGRRSTPNVLLFTFDTLRADRVGAYGFAPASTPTLDGLSRRGVRFEYVQSASPLTGPSHATILTGLYPPVHGVRENVNFVLGDEHPTLPSILKQRGYRTAAFVGAYPVAAAFGFDHGFDVFSEGFHESKNIGQSAERPANEVADAAIGWLSEPKPGPFMMWVHFYDPHAPYAPPPAYRDRFGDRPYDGEVAFADSQAGRILDALKATGRLEDTIVVAVSDHGEGFGEHEELTHGLLVYDSTLRVPLIIAGPGVPEGRVVTDPAATADILPTVLALLNQEGAPAGLPGHSLVGAFRGTRAPERGLYAEALFGRLNCRWASLRSWTEGPWKLIEGATPELFDRSSDPGETRDRAADQPDRVSRMSAALATAVRTMAPQGDTARPAAISSEQAERLRSLGYTAGTGGAGSLDERGLPDPRRLISLFERLEVLQGASGQAIPPALEEVSRILALDAGNPYAHFVAGALAYQAGELDRGRQFFARSLELDPDRPVIRQYYGALLRDMGRLEESERQLRLATEQEPSDDFLAQIALSQTLVASGKFEEARVRLRAVLDRSPTHIKAHGAMGRLFLAQNKPGEAIPHLNRAIDGGDLESRMRLAEARLALGDPRAAHEAAMGALQRAPGHPWALSLAGHALAAAGRRSEGLVLLERAVSVGPRRAEVWASLAAAFDAAGDTARAARCRQRAVSKPTRPAA